MSAMASAAMPAGSTQRMRGDIDGPGASILWPAFADATSITE